MITYEGLDADYLSIKNIAGKTYILEIKISYEIKDDNAEPMEDYLVIFDTDGGNPITPQTIEEGNKAIKPDNPTKDGFEFLGWFIGEEEFDFETLITKDISLVAKWTSIDGEKILATYNFTQFVGKKGEAFASGAALVTAFNSVSSNENVLISALNVDSIYQGNGSGGGDYQNKEGVLKTGTSSKNGTMTLTFTETITKITLLLRGWGATDTLEINGVKITLPATLQEITIELNEPSNMIMFTFGRRALVEQIAIIG